MSQLLFGDDRVLAADKEVKCVIQWLLSVEFVIWGSHEWMSKKIMWFSVQEILNERMDGNFMAIEA